MSSYKSPLWPVIGILVFLLLGCSGTPGSVYPYQHTGMTMGTTYTIKASRLPDSIKPAQVTARIEEVLKKVNGQMSTYDDKSELSLFNRSVSTDWQPVSSEFYTVLKEALNISQLTGGLFDVTVGPLVNLWGFGPEELPFKQPDDQMINERLKLIGYQHLQIKENELFAKKDMPGLYVDLSAIAKGYAVDQVASVLESFKINDYMVEIGGEIRVKGKNKEGESWHIAVEKPAEELRAIEKILKITDTGMATSGDYRNYFEIEGRRFSHEIDPRTGRPITNKLASITVLNDTSMEADALATAIMIMGPEEGLEFTEKNRIPAFFIIKSDKGFEEKMSTAFINSTKVTK